MAATTQKAGFDGLYVSTNIRPDAPKYSSDLVAKFKSRLLALGPEWEDYSYAVLTSIFIGCHRPDYPPRLFEEALATLDLGSDEGVKRAREIFLRIREAIMVIWPFVGIPWCVPAGLGLVAVLQRHGIEVIGKECFRSSFNQDDHYRSGREIHMRTYAKVNNPEVRELLSVGFPEFREATTAIVWGYNISGATQSGLFQDYQTELIVAAAIHSEGASRQARSHVKASLGMGNSLDAVKCMVEIGAEFATWAGVPLPHTIDVDALKAQVDAVSS
ncbi:hypothetical protein BJY01DRAFT_254016 [Aspergillus pseudoustus]|uniref:Carboxymuconolactone decarboxylase-like domain-containing protein n=1 Tax=Aspergillus pseudoustus TaxID=1810923 RepID=A0ABR4IZA1_9EURO